MKISERIKEDWEKWFAWHPVAINGKRVWGRMVYRRYCYTRIFGERFNETYEYGNLFDVLKD